jgi:hypothetical protein
MAMSKPEPTEGVRDKSPWLMVVMLILNPRSSSFSLDGRVHTSSKTITSTSMHTSPSATGKKEWLAVSNLQVNRRHRKKMQII